MGYTASGGAFGFKVTSAYTGTVSVDNNVTSPAGLEPFTDSQIESLALGQAGLRTWGSAFSLGSGNTVWTLKINGTQKTATLGSNTIVTFNNECPTDLTATKTDNTNGVATVGQEFYWTVTVANAGPFDAYFPDGSVVFTDVLPPGPTYDEYLGGIDGVVHCELNGDTITCTAVGLYALQAGTSFTARVGVVAHQPGSYTNPGVADGCVVDPNGLINEYNGIAMQTANNYCSDTVRVVAAPTMTPPPNFTVILPTLTTTTTTTPSPTETASPSATPSPTSTATATTTKTASPNTGGTEGGTGRPGSGSTPKAPATGSGSSSNGSSVWLIMLAVIGGSAAFTGAGWLATKKR